VEQSNSFTFFFYLVMNKANDKLLQKVYFNDRSMFESLLYF